MKRVLPAVWADPDVVPFAAKVSVWGRWIIWLVAVFLLAYRPADWYPANIEYVFLHVPLVTFNGLVHFRLLTNRPVTWRWLFVLSAMGHCPDHGGHRYWRRDSRASPSWPTIQPWPCLPRSSRSFG